MVKHKKKTKKLKMKSNKLYKHRKMSQSKKKSKQLKSKHSRRSNGIDKEKGILKNVIYDPNVKTIKSIFINSDKAQKYNNTFSKIINFSLPDQTDQKSSGRCWIFAFLNTLRPKFIKDHDLPKNFEFSTNYLFFYHKLECASYFLDKIVKYFQTHTNPEYYEDRLYQYLLSDPISDGGRSNILMKLVSTYGIVPEKVFRNTPRSNKTSQFDTILKQNLILYSDQIRKIIEEKKIKNPKISNKMIERDIKPHINKFKKQIRSILEIFLGTPPNPTSKFTFNYYKSNTESNSGPQSKKKHDLVTIKKTPMEFFNMTGFKKNNYITCVNYPSLDFNKYYNIDYCENDTKYPTKCFNLPIVKLINAVKLSIDDDEPVWFACDISQYRYKHQGILDQNIFDMTMISQFDRNIKKITDMKELKKELAKNKLSTPSHAMTFIGYDLDSKQNITKFKVENSWGEYKEQENKGYLTMSIDWFKLFVFEIFVKSKYIGNHSKDKYETVSVKPWGLMGCNSFI